MRIHPVFYNSLLKPYIETPEHGPNFPRPPLEIVEGQEGYYKIEKILAACPTQNRKSTQYQYLVHWKGYPSSDNSWLPAKELQNAQELVKVSWTALLFILHTYFLFQTYVPTTPSYGKYWLHKHFCHVLLTSFVFCYLLVPSLAF